MKPNNREEEQEVIEIPTPDMQDNHVAEFVNAVRTKNKNLISCTIEDGFKSTAAVQLSMIAYETGEKLVWDNQKGSISNNTEAAKLLARPYRQGYK